MTLNPAPSAQTLAALAERFEWFAEQVFRGSSPLYEWLAANATEDQEILALAAHIPDGQPEPNLLFGAVHFLLLQGEKHPAGDYFPSLTPSPRPVEEAYPAFRAFCLDHIDQIIPLLETRRVQTNEVRRCAYWLPAFEYVGQLESDRPLALIEIGPSAGLNLLWDRYGYVYNRELQAGDQTSPVKIACEARGDYLPPIPTDVPSVTFRVGIDLDPGDVRDQEAMLWQRSLLWPDQPERADLFWKAVDVARRDPPRLVAGDALEKLPAVLAETPADAVVAVYHSFVLNQFKPESRHALDEMLKVESQQRSLYRASIEWYPRRSSPQLELFAYHGGQEEHRLLAACDQHGRWLEWLSSSK